MEEEDEIIKEVDVYLNQTLTNELFLFQYPLRPVYRQQNTNESDQLPDSLSRLTSFKIKPKFHKMQMEFKLDNHSSNFDEDCELLFDAGTGGKAAEEFTTLLTSSKVPTRTNYAVGILRDSMYHVIQFRPSFSHIDENDSKKKKREEKMETDENDESMNVEKETEKEAESIGNDLKPIQVQFKKKDVHNQNPKVLAQRRKSLLKQQEAEEPFQEYNYKNSQTEDSYNELEKLLYSKDDMEGIESKPAEVVIPAPATVGTYLDLINPQPSDAYAQPVQSKQVPLHALRKLPVEKQVYHLLVNAVVIKFDTVLELTVGYTSESEILQALEKYGVLIRGLWALKSEFCFESKKMRLIRDFLLCLLSQHEFVQRKEFMKHVGRFISNEGAKDLLETVAVHSTKGNNNNLDNNSKEQTKGWKLKQPPDVVFQLKYPAVTEKYNTYWKDQLKTVTEGLATLWNAPKETPSVQPKMTSAPVRTPQAIPQTTNPAPTQQQPATSHAPSNQNQHLLFLKEMFQTYGVCSFQLLKQNLIKRQHEKNGPLSGVTDDMLRAGLNEIAGTLHNAYFLKSLDNPFIDKFRDVIIGLFKQTVSLKKSDIVDACQSTLGEPIPQSTYNKIIKELAYAKGSTQIFKSGSGAD